MFVILDGGIALPIPKKTEEQQFHREQGIPERRWRSGKLDRWMRAYTHCLYSLGKTFDTPVHKAINAISRGMLEATEPNLVALRFIGEMHLAGYIDLHEQKMKGSKDKFERIIIPTEKLLGMNLEHKDAPVTAIKYPTVCGSRGYQKKVAQIRHGVSSPENNKVASITRDMSKEMFTINEFVLELMTDFPPDKVTDKEFKTKYMLKRTLDTAKVLRGQNFRFGYFLDSRSRMYDATTCGVSPQGSDYEKALLIPTYAEPLTDRGLKQLVLAAWGYSEIEWDIPTMVSHARNPYRFAEDWQKSDKPYSYMACANLLSLYEKDPTTPLPAFRPLDGRCSGLQHWSALCRSQAITAHLGMELNEHPLDIYEKVAEDWEKSLPESQKHFATRKAAKIPVMTWGYNATRMTSMEWLDKMYGQKTKWDRATKGFVVYEDGLERATAGKLGCDLYDQLNSTLAELTTAVGWVSDCATIISKAGNCDIHWPTPDGFECKQRKLVGVEKSLNITLSDGSRFTVGILDYSEQKPAHNKHRSAIAPNVIHSLDATHLRMVARELAQLGLPMVFIHDSFATHVNHTDTLYDLITSTFADLYKGNWMLELMEYWAARYNVCIPDPPVMGDWNPEIVKILPRFFM